MDGSDPIESNSDRINGRSNLRNVQLIIDHRLNQLRHHKKTLYVLKPLQNTCVIQSRDDVFSSWMYYAQAVHEPHTLPWTMYELTYKEVINEIRNATTGGPRRVASISSECIDMFHGGEPLFDMFLAIGVPLAESAPMLTFPAKGGWPHRLRESMYEVVAHVECDLGNIPHGIQFIMKFIMGCVFPKDALDKLKDTKELATICDSLFSAYIYAHRVTINSINGAIQPDREAYEKAQNSKLFKYEAPVVDHDRKVDLRMLDLDELWQKIEQGTDLLEAGIPLQVTMNVTDIAGNTRLMALQVELHDDDDISVYRMKTKQTVSPTLLATEKLMLCDSRTQVDSVLSPVTNQWSFNVKQAIATTIKMMKVGLVSNPPPDTEFNWIVHMPPHNFVVDLSNYVDWNEEQVDEFVSELQIEYDVGLKRDSVDVNFMYITASYVLAEKTMYIWMHSYATYQTVMDSCRQLYVATQIVAALSEQVSEQVNVDTLTADFRHYTSISSMCTIDQLRHDRWNALKLMTENYIRPSISDEKLLVLRTAMISSCLQYDMKPVILYKSRSYSVSGPCVPVSGAMVCYSALSPHMRLLHIMNLIVADKTAAITAQAFVGPVCIGRTARMMHRNHILNEGVLEINADSMLLCLDELIKERNMGVGVARRYTIEFVWHDGTDNARGNMDRFTHMLQTTGLFTCDVVYEAGDINDVLLVTDLQGLEQQVPVPWSTERTGRIAHLFNHHTNLTSIKYRGVEIARMSLESHDARVNAIVESCLYLRQGAVTPEIETLTIQIDMLRRKITDLHTDLTTAKHWRYVGKPEDIKAKKARIDEMYATNLTLSQELRVAKIQRHEQFMQHVHHDSESLDTRRKTLRTAFEGIVHTSLIGDNTVVCRISNLARQTRHMFCNVRIPSSGVILREMEVLIARLQSNPLQPMLPLAAIVGIDTPLAKLQRQRTEFTESVQSHAASEPLTCHDLRPWVYCDDILPLAMYGPVDLQDPVFSDEAYRTIVKELSDQKIEDSKLVGYPNDGVVPEEPAPGETDEPVRQQTQQSEPSTQPSFVEKCLKLPDEESAAVIKNLDKVLLGLLGIEEYQDKIPSNTTSLPDDQPAHIDPPSSPSRRKKQIWPKTRHLVPKPDDDPTDVIRRPIEGPKWAHYGKSFLQAASLPPSHDPDGGHPRVDTRPKKHIPDMEWWELLKHYKANGYPKPLAGGNPDYRTAANRAAVLKPGALRVDSTPHHARPLLGDPRTLYNKRDETTLPAWKPHGDKGKPLQGQISPLNPMLRKTRGPLPGIVEELEQEVHKVVDELELVVNEAVHAVSLERPSTPAAGAPGETDKKRIYADTKETIELEEAKKQLLKLEQEYNELKPKIVPLRNQSPMAAQKFAADKLARLQNNQLKLIFAVKQTIVELEQAKVKREAAELEQLKSGKWDPNTIDLSMWSRKGAATTYATAAARPRKGPLPPIRQRKPRDARDARGRVIIPDGPGPLPLTRATNKKTATDGYQNNMSAEEVEEEQWHRNAELVIRSDARAAVFSRAARDAQVIKTGKGFTLDDSATDEIKWTKVKHKKKVGDRPTDATRFKLKPSQIVLDTEFHDLLKKMPNLSYEMCILNNEDTKDYEDIEQSQINDTVHKHDMTEWLDSTSTTFQLESDRVADIPLLSWLADAIDAMDKQTVRGSPAESPDAVTQSGHNLYHLLLLQRNKDLALMLLGICDHYSNRQMQDVIRLHCFNTDAIKMINRTSGDFGDHYIAMDEWRNMCANLEYRLLHQQIVTRDDALKASNAELKAEQLKIDAIIAATATHAAALEAATLAESGESAQLQDKIDALESQTAVLEGELKAKQQAIWIHRDSGDYQAERVAIEAFRVVSTEISKLQAAIKAAKSTESAKLQKKIDVLKYEMTTHTVAVQEKLHDIDAITAADVHADFMLIGQHVALIPKLQEPAVYDGPTEIAKIEHTDELNEYDTVDYLFQVTDVVMQLTRWRQLASYVHQGLYPMTLRMRAYHVLNYLMVCCAVNKVVPDPDPDSVFDMQTICFDLLREDEPMKLQPSQRPDSWLSSSAKLMNHLLRDMCILERVWSVITNDDVTDSIEAQVRPYLTICAISQYIFHRIDYLIGAKRGIGMNDARPCPGLRRFTRRYEFVQLGRQWPEIPSVITKDKQPAIVKVIRTIHPHQNYPPVANSIALMLCPAYTQLVQTKGKLRDKREIYINIKESNNALDKWLTDDKYSDADHMQPLTWEVYNRFLDVQFGNERELDVKIVNQILMERGNKVLASMIRCVRDSSYQTGQKKFKERVVDGITQTQEVLRLKHIEIIMRIYCYDAETVGYIEETSNHLLRVRPNWEFDNSNDLCDHLRQILVLLDRHIKKNGNRPSQLKDAVALNEEYIKRSNDAQIRQFEIRSILFTAHAGAKCYKECTQESNVFLIVGYMMRRLLERPYSSISTHDESANQFLCAQLLLHTYCKLNEIVFNIDGATKTKAQIYELMQNKEESYHKKDLWLIVLTCIIHAENESTGLSDHLDVCLYYMARHVMYRQGFNMDEFKNDDLYDEPEDMPSIDSISYQLDHRRQSRLEGTSPSPIRLLPKGPATKKDMNFTDNDDLKYMGYLSESRLRNVDKCRL